MAETIGDFFVYLRYSFDFLIIVLFLIFLPKIKSEKGLWAIAFFCLLDLASNLIIDFFSLSQSLFIIIYALFTLWEYMLFAYFIWLNIHNKKTRKTIVFASIAFIIFIVIYNLTAKPVSADSIPIGIETILILLFSFYYLYEQMNDTKSLFIYSKFSFWIITGFMIYLSGSFFIYIFANQIERDVLENQYWFLTNVFFVIGTIFFAIGIIVCAKQLKKPTSKNHNITIPHSSF